MSAADNHWRIYKNGLLVWTASLPIRADAPRELLEWTLSIIELGESTEMARFRKEDGTYWPKSELSAYLERRLNEASIVDAFAFSDRADRIGSKVAFHEDDGVHEALIDDMGGLFERLVPPREDEYRGPIRRLPPLSFGGHAISFDPSATLHSAHHLPSTSVKVRLSNDIWFPWIPGRIEFADREIFHDNRALAERHTPRFNRFIGGLRASVLERGGRWERTFFRGEEWIAPMLGPDDTVDLSATAPAMSLEQSPYA